MTRKLLPLLLALLLVLTALPAFTSAEAVDPATLEPVEFDWYFGQTEMPDCQMVNDAVNVYLKEKINATVKMHFWGTAADWETKMTTMLSAGQDVGIVGFGSQSKLDYVVQSQRGAYLPIEGLLDTYGKETKALFNDEVWGAMTINGHIYGIPSLKDNGYFISLIYNATMCEELGIDVESVKYSNFRDLEPLFKEAKEKRDAKYPDYADRPVCSGVSLVYPYYFAFETFLNDSYLAVCNIPGMEQLAGYDTDTAVNFYGTDEFMQFCLDKQRQVELGYYAYDYTDKNDWNLDGYNMFWVGWGYTNMEEHLYGNNFVTKMKMSDTLWTETNNYYSAGTAICANSSQPERQMMMLNLVNNDPDFATMMRFGIEGEHYVINDEGKMQFEGSKRNSGERADWGYFHWYMAPIGNLTIVRAPESLTGPDGIMLTKMIEYNNICTVPNHMGFVLDTEPIRNQLAACTSVVNEYQATLANGQASSQDEVTELVTEFRDKLTANGVDAIVAEVQKQMDAWKAAK